MTTLIESMARAGGRRTRANRSYARPLTGDPERVLVYRKLVR